MANNRGGGMKYKCIKNPHSCFTMGKKISVGAICYVEELDKIPTIFYKNMAICQVDSRMAKECFEEVSE